MTFVMKHTHARTHTHSVKHTHTLTHTHSMIKVKVYERSGHKELPQENKTDGQDAETMTMTMKNPIALMTCTLLFSSLAVLAHQGSFGPDECCFAFISSRLRKDAVQSYRLTDERCSMEGVSFTLKNGVKVCADPSHRWVKSLIKAQERL
ncbi:C-C motif chemokine 4-like [Pungitius pungitius]|uniref:C-C motif chemokine 4-like n=1 Tax=Pungitius pungitius TaxID=134920 RepID=UPI002E11DEC5